QKAELARANLQKAWLAEANLQGALLEKANLQEARLEEANLQEVRLDGAELQRASFSWVDLRRANLAGARLVCTRLLRVDLREALLDGACLVYTDLCGTRLQGATLDGARIRFVVLTSARGMAQLQLCTLKAAKPPLQRLVAVQAVDRRTKRLAPRSPLDIAQDHRLLKLYFRQEGRQDLSSRHYLAEMRWMRKHYRQTRQWSKLLPSWMYGGLCGYGERPWLVGVWSLLSIVSCCLLLIAKDLHAGILAPHLWVDYALASTWAFAAAPAPHLLAPSGASGLTIAVTEALIGKFLISLFVFTLGRKVER
ncbi:MAG: pentapeptide repeat-containing protein, partial [Promethearchaeota archaeon]